MNETLTIEEALHKYGKVVHAIKGDSMLPMLEEDNDVVELIPVNEKLKKYDLPLYRRPNGKLVLHRIIDVKKKHYLICGDNRTNVEKVPFDWVIAVTTGFYKNGKYISCEEEAYQEYVKNHCSNIENREILQKVPNEWKVILKLFRMAIIGKPEPLVLEKPVDWNKVYKICKRQKICATIHSAIACQDCPKEIKELFLTEYMKNMRRKIMFDAERSNLCVQLDEKQIRYMPLKGVLFAELFSDAYMREFSDNDILIDYAKREDVCEIFRKQGYQCKMNPTVHDNYYKEPIYNFEMHHKLFIDNKIQPCFADVWERASKVSETSREYRMSREDLYLHMVGHFHKHYTKSGAGIRAFADMYFLLKKSEGMDWKYIKEKLKKMDMEDFATFYKEMTKHLFEGNLEDIPQNTVAYWFGSGAYGTRENSVRNNITKVGKAKYLWNRIFLPYDIIKGAYPILENVPILLPFCWVIRIVGMLFSGEKRKKFQQEMRVLTRAGMKRE